MKTKQCIQCGCDFYPRATAQKTCSAKCKRERYLAVGARWREEHLTYNRFWRSSNLRYKRGKRANRVIVITIPYGPKQGTASFRVEEQAV